MTTGKVMFKTPNAIALRSVPLHRPLTDGALACYPVAMRADFYHLTSLPVERALPAIAEKILSIGSTLAVVADSDALLAGLDKALWTYRPDSFLPHGREGDQPVLLTGPDTDIAAYPHVALADGIWRDAALAHERAFFFFDEATIEGARTAWRSLADRAEVERHYWKQDEQGRWREGP